MLYLTHKTQTADALGADTWCKSKEGTFIFVKTNDFTFKFNFKKFFERLKSWLREWKDSNYDKESYFSNERYDTCLLNEIKELSLKLAFLNVTIIKSM